MLSTIKRKSGCSENFIPHNATGQTLELEQFGENTPDNEHNRQYRNYGTDQTPE